MDTRCKSSLRQGVGLRSCEGEGRTNPGAYCLPPLVLRLQTCSSTLIFLTIIFLKNYAYFCIFLWGLVHVFPEARCIGYAWSWNYRWLSGTGYGCWESNLDPLEEQNMLLTIEPLSGAHTRTHTFILTIDPEDWTQIFMLTRQALYQLSSPLPSCCIFDQSTSAQIERAHALACRVLSPAGNSCEVRTAASCLLWEPQQNQDLQFLCISI